MGSSPSRPTAAGRRAGTRRSHRRSPHRPQSPCPQRAVAAAAVAAAVVTAPAAAGCCCCCCSSPVVLPTAAALRAAPRRGRARPRGVGSRRGPWAARSAARLRRRWTHGTVATPRRRPAVAAQRRAQIGRSARTGTTARTTNRERTALRRRRRRRTMRRRTAADRHRTGKSQTETATTAARCTAGAGNDRGGRPGTGGDGPTLTQSAAPSGYESRYAGARGQGRSRRGASSDSVERRRGGEGAQGSCGDSTSHTSLSAVGYVHAHRDGVSKSTTTTTARRVLQRSPKRGTEVDAAD